MWIHNVDVLRALGVNSPVLWALDVNSQCEFTVSTRCEFTMWTSSIFHNVDVLWALDVNSRQIWLRSEIRHIKWDLTHSCLTHMWYDSYMWHWLIHVRLTHSDTSSEIWLIHVLRALDVSLWLIYVWHDSFMWDLTHSRPASTWCEWVKSHMNESMSHIYESYHIWMSHVAQERVTSRMNASRHIWTHHVTYERITSHIWNCNAWLSSYTSSTCSKKNNKHAKTHWHVQHDSSVGTYAYIPYFHPIAMKRDSFMCLTLLLRLYVCIHINPYICALRRHL